MAVRTYIIIPKVSEARSKSHHKYVHGYKHTLAPPVQVHRSKV